MLEIECIEFGFYASELSRSIIFVEVFNPKLDDAAPRATHIPMPSNKLFVISPVNAPANVAMN